MNTNEYSYILSEEKIAIYPLPQRDTSKLLIYKNRQVFHSVFRSLPDQLPPHAFLFFNNTKVIPARLLFKKITGAKIEILLLHPKLPSLLASETMASSSPCTWQCAIGNLKRWPNGTSLKIKMKDKTLEAFLTDREKALVEFRWNNGGTFAEVIQAAGETPLPPYIKRKPDPSDGERYQTIYAHFDGAIAAPTAGLHFTPSVLDKLRKNNIPHDFITLHVSAGTFQPIKTENADDHIMHKEQIIITRENVSNLLNQSNLITAVGTTSMRTLESLYWFGARLLINRDSEFKINQNDPYTYSQHPSRQQAITAVWEYMERNRIENLVGETAIFIKPGYNFKICQALITNFHQPGSTLMLLVAAFVGGDWRKIYDEALNNNYRFLSYGDSSLLIPG